MARRNLKPSEGSWISSAIIGAIAVLLIDWWYGEFVGFWPTVTIWVIIGGGTFIAWIRFEAQRTIVDKLK